MQFLKKLAWTILLILLFGGFVYGGLYVRNALTAKNYADYWQQRTIDVADFVYVAIGDSTALGVGSTDPKKSYVGLVSSNIQEMTGKLVKVVNLATADADIDAVISDQLPKLKSYKPDLITISVGLVDINKGRDKTTIMQKYSTLLGVLPTRISYIAELPSVLDPKKDQLIQIVNSELTQVADETGVNMVPLYRITKANSYGISSYDWDFAHPNDKGYKAWAEAFINVIQ